MKNHLQEHLYRTILRIIKMKENLFFHTLNRLVKMPLRAQTLIKNPLHTFIPPA